MSLSSGLVLVFAIFLGACGKGSNTSDGGSQTYLNFKSGFCSMNVIVDRNDVLHACESNKSPAECKSRLKAFIEKYPDINCKGFKESEDKDGQEVFEVKVQEYKEWIKKLNVESIKELTYMWPALYQEYVEDNQEHF